jgi:hypothetical protein
MEEIKFKMIPSPSHLETFLGSYLCECDAAGRPAVYVIPFKFKNSFAVGWEINESIINVCSELRTELRNTHERYWKLKRPARGEHVLDLIAPLSIDEARECAEAVFDILMKYKVNASEKA